MEMDRDEIDEAVFDHAWNWFNLHAAQRMQTFNFFLVTTAFLIAAYATLLEKLPLAALVIALVGSWIAFWFTRLDNRTRQLIKAGEEVLKTCQSAMARRTNIPTIEILEAVDKPTEDALSYTIIIAVIEWTVFTVFLFSAAYASYRFSCLR